MYTTIKHSFKELNFKLKRSINYNLNLLVKNRKTKHLFYVKKYKKGEFLVEQNKKVHGIYFIANGSVKIFNVESNKAVILRLASKGDVVGLSSLNFEFYLSSIVALDEVEVYFLTMKHLKQILKSTPKLGFLLINYLSFNLQYFELRHKHNSLFSAKGRIIESLLLIANEFGEITEKGIEITDCIQRNDIAAVANTTYETVIRVLKKLKLRGAILVENRKIIIKDKDYLLNSLKKHCDKKEEIENSSCSYLDLLY